MGEICSKSGLRKGEAETAKIETEDPVVPVSCGKVRGKVCHVIDSTVPVYTFLGIPYAAPPVGDQRFLPPKPAEPWSEVRDATKLGPMCPQNLDATRSSFLPVPLPDTSCDEDCLQVNIYTCHLDQTVKKPVMFYIHGGSYNKGGAAFYDGTAYATYGDVVVVTVGYRVGFLGFVHTGDESCPGNLGLLDQVTALRWLQQNIINFGGDPNNVTIFGESAGAVSVQSLLVSPLSVGLFHKAISQSGTVIIPNLIPANTPQRKWALAKILGCESTDGKEVINFVRTIPVDRIIEAQNKLIATGLEPALSLDGHFLEDRPQELYQSGNFQKIPHLIGFNSDEGYYFCNSFFPGFLADSFNEEKALAFLARFVSTLFPRHVEQVTKLVTEMYFSPSEKERRNDLGYLRTVMSCAVGEMFLSSGIWRSGELHSEHAPTFMYIYAHKPSYSRFPVTPYGGSHEEELLFSWGDPFMDRPVNKVVSYTEPEKELSMKMIKYWTNFARMGNPNGEDLVEWPQFDKEKAQYLRLDCSIQVKDHFKTEHMQFWNQTIRQLVNS